VSAGVPLILGSGTATQARIVNVKNAFSLDDSNCLVIRETLARPNCRIAVLRRPGNQFGELDSQFQPLVKYLDRLIASKSGAGRRERLHVLVTNLNQGMAVLDFVRRYKGRLLCRLLVSGRDSETDLQSRSAHLVHANVAPYLTATMLDGFAASDGWLDVLVTTATALHGFNPIETTMVIVWGAYDTVELMWQALGRGHRRGGSYDFVVICNRTDTRKVAEGSVLARFLALDGSECRHDIVLCHFGETVDPNRLRHACCDVCAKDCGCDECKISGPDEKEVAHAQSRSPSQEPGSEGTEEMVDLTNPGGRFSVAREALMIYRDTKLSVLGDFRSLLFEDSLLTRMDDPLLTAAAHVWAESGTGGVESDPNLPWLDRSSKAELVEVLKNLDKQVDRV
jgi:hypothetical protein